MNKTVSLVFVLSLLAVAAAFPSQVRINNEVYDVIAVEQPASSDDLELAESANPQFGHHHHHGGFDGGYGGYGGGHGGYGGYGGYGGGFGGYGGGFGGGYGGHGGGHHHHHHGHGGFF